jgi:predicted ATPase
LQSKLADLYSEVAEDSSYKFLIETHSEYLVRRTQVLVAQLGASDQKELDKQNPFKTYYFPEDGTPYDMKYTLSGRFENKFDTGFFDESAKWHMEILRKEKEGK